MPYDEEIMLLKIRGGQLKRMMAYMLREDMLSGKRGEFYQFSGDLKITYDRGKKSFERFEFEGEPLDDDRILSVGLSEYHYKGFGEFFGFPISELGNGRCAVAATSLRDVLEEYFDTAHQITANIEGRLVIK